MSAAAGRYQRVARAVGEAVRARRLLLGLNQVQLGERLHEERTHVCELERGRRLPMLHTLIAVAAALGCSAADIVRDAEAAL